MNKLKVSWRFKLSGFPGADRANPCSLSSNSSDKWQDLNMLMSVLCNSLAIYLADSSSVTLFFFKVLERCNFWDLTFHLIWVFFKSIPTWMLPNVNLLKITRSKSVPTSQNTNALCHTCWTNNWQIIKGNCAAPSMDSRRTHCHCHWREHRLHYSHLADTDIQSG